MRNRYRQSSSGPLALVVGRWSLVVGRWSLVVGRLISTQTTDDPDPVSAYSSDIARQLGAQRLAYQLLERDPEAAQQVIDAYVADPGLHAEMQDRIDYAR